MLVLFSFLASQWFFLVPLWLWPYEELEWIFLADCWCSEKFFLGSLGLVCPRLRNHTKAGLSSLVQTAHGWKTACLQKMAGFGFSGSCLCQSLDGNVKPLVLRTQGACGSKSVYFSKSVRILVPVKDRLWFRLWLRDWGTVTRVRGIKRLKLDRNSESTVKMCFSYISVWAGQWTLDQI